MRPDEALVADRFRDVVTSEAQLRSIIGRPSYWLQGKILTRLNGRCRRFVAASPFVVLASVGAGGSVDVSPKGDPAGFVRIIDDTTLAVPDQPGNRRVDTFQNILGNSNVGLIFFVPGRRETLRVAGRGAIVRDLDLRRATSVAGRVPELALVVSVERAFFHCGRCVARGQLWGSHAPAAEPEDIAEGDLDVRL